MNKNIEYIASGTSYMRTNAPRNYEDAETVEFISSAFRKVSEETNHKFGLLYNAFTEAGFGEQLRKYSGYHSIHADSGGLQIVTQGKTITDELKEGVYKNQGQWSDLAMSFDEIPIGTVTGKSGRNDTNNRWFKADELEYYARLSGQNIKRQIETFLKYDSKSKPIFIAQGNCYDSYMKWAEYGMQEIPQELHQYIGGVAMGAAALGTGTLEDIQRAVFFKSLPIDAKHLHILGVGSAKRLMPYLIFMQNGYYDDISVSYDSTTHTSGVELGLFFNKDFEGTSFNRIYNRVYESMFANMAELFDLSTYDAKAFHNVMNTGYTKFAEAGGNSLDFSKLRISFIITSIINFCKQVDAMLDSKDVTLKLADKSKFYQPAKLLYNVKSKQDFDYWMMHVGRKVKSNKIANTKPASIEDFFE